MVSDPIVLVDDPAPMVRRVTLNRPEKRNALNDTLRQALFDALRAADDDREVSAVIIRGAGPCFSAGYDLGERNTPVERLAIGLLLLPFVLILKEPDLGSALVLLPAGLAMMFVASPVLDRVNQLKPVREAEESTKFLCPRLQKGGLIRSWNPAINYSLPQHRADEVHDGVETLDSLLS